MTVPIRRGGLYWIPDTAVQLPPTTNKERVLHPRRPFLVSSNDDRNVDPSWPIVLGFPLTTSDRLHSEYDVELARGSCALPEACDVQVPLLQPIAKTKLWEYVGQLPANLMEQVTISLVKYMEGL